MPVMVVVTVALLVNPVRALVGTRVMVVVLAGSLLAVVAALAGVLPSAVYGTGITVVGV